MVVQLYIKLTLISLLDTISLLCLIDTVKFWSVDIASLGTDHLKYLAQFILEPDIGFYKGHDRLTGKLGNLRISAWPTGISIQGSLSRFFLGSNLHTLTPTDLKGAVEKVSDELHLDFSKFKVTRLDVADNLFVKEVPSSYMPIFGKNGRYKRLEQPDGIYYRSSKKELILYDKVAQVKATRGLSVPDEFKDRNILRFEFRLKNSVANQLNRTEVTASTLTDATLYEQLVDMWAGEFFQIKKNRMIRPKPHAVSSKKDFRRMLMSRGILELGGEAAVESLITQGVLLGYIKSNMDKKRLRDELKSICQDTDYTEISVALEELNAKINERVEILKNRK